MWLDSWAIIISFLASKSASERKIRPPKLNGDISGDVTTVTRVLPIIQLSPEKLHLAILIMPMIKMITPNKLPPIISMTTASTIGFGWGEGVSRLLESVARVDQSKF